MTEKEARKLKVGDRIQTDQLPVGELHIGEIIDVGYHGFTAKWDDGQAGMVDFRGAAKFTRVTNEASTPKAVEKSNGATVGEGASR